MYGLILRPEPGASTLADTFTSLGITPVYSPVISIVYQTDLPVMLKKAQQEKVQAYITTSHHGITALSQATNDRSTPLLVVGKHSTETAKKYRFQAIHQADGSAQSLYENIIQNYSPQAGKFIYISADITAFNMEESLTQQHFDVETIIGYHAIAITTLSDEAIATLTQQEEPVLIPFYSKRSTELFSRLVKHHQILWNTAKKHAWALSDNISKATSALEYETCTTLDNPTHDEMHTSLTQWMHERHNHTNFL